MSDELEQLDVLGMENNNVADHDLKSASIPTQGKVQMLKVMKRDGSHVDFDRSKIENAMYKCYMDPSVYGDNVDDVQSIRDRIRAMTDNIVTKLELTLRPSIMVEEIQNLVEFELMDAKEYLAARAYIIFRTTRAAERPKTEKTEKVIHVLKKNGKRELLDERGLLRLCHEAAEGLSHVDAEDIRDIIVKQLYDGVTEAEVGEAMTLAARSRIERHPNYSFMAARLLLSRCRRETFNKLGIVTTNSQKALAGVYGEVLRKSLDHGIKIKIIDPQIVARFDLTRLGEVMEENAYRDFQFEYHGLQTLYDRYFIHEKKVRIELPQSFLMRVAMGIAANEDNATERAIEFYLLLSSFDYMTSTPTLFNSATLKPQMSSCFLTTIPDDLFGIFGGIQDNAMLSKFAGGIGNDWTPVRAITSAIKGTNGNSSGVVPFMKVANDTAVAVNQGGKRKGAVCAYLETWHRDIEEFLDLRKNTGDDRRRTHDMNTCNWVPDLFMERVMEDGNWTLFSPEEVPELHDLVGNAFKAKYEEYEAKVKAGEIEVFKEVKAVTLWRKMLQMLFETGHPWITFKDPCNLRSPQQHAGVVHSSNLCTEITLNTKAGEEIAVCNLGSINMPAHMNPDGSINHAKLERTITTAMRMLDNVIDRNYYTVEAARTANMRHRPVGLGVMGFQDVLYKLRVPYASDRSAEVADEWQEAISYYSIKGSATLARERGSYESFEGSLWHQGILPIDSQRILAQHRKSEYYKPNFEETRNFDWDALREYVRGGMRNSNTMAIAPTATISDIIAQTQSIEPKFENLYTRSSMSGEFTTINRALVEDLIALDLWDESMNHDLKYYDGSVQFIERIPADLKELYRTAFDVEPKYLINAAARRQKWIDQAQSLNLYMAKPDGKKLDAMYKLAWTQGLKTTYYLRSMGATSTEKSTTEDRKLNQVAQAPVTPAAAPKVCAIDAGPDCEACQ